MNFKLYIVFLFSLVVFMVSSDNYLLAAQRYELPAGRYICELSLSIAKSQAGVTDANNPAQVRAYLKSAGVGYYNPFCQSGQYWAFVQAQKSIRWINAMLGYQYGDKIPIPKSALANSSYNYALKHGNKTAYVPQRGDLLIWRRGTGINGHIERVDSVLTGGWVRTIAFNTDNREVKFKKRNIYHILGRLMVRGLVGFKYESL